MRIRTTHPYRGRARFAVWLATLVWLVGAAIQVGLSAQAPGSVDVDRLPISMERIHRELRESATREEHDGLRLRYFVDVYAQTPPIVIFGPDANLKSGPVPYGGPTHREMVEQMTPQEFRAPAADFSALFRWLAERAQKK
jgi:hypothetical protein